MTKNYFTYYKYYAVVLIVGLTLVGIYTIQQFSNHFSFPIIGIGLLVAILELIDRYLWKYKPFLWMFTIEDFSGTYEGEQIGYRLMELEKKGSCKEIETKLYLTMTIYQTGSKITIHSFYYDAAKEKSSMSQSETLAMGVTKDGQHYTIVYHYHNKGNERWDGHFGTTVMTLFKESEKIKVSGSYYTDRKPQTRGKFLNLTQKSKSTKHPF